jgi:tRNA-2-methylthio-N6-dimethylallyladenosine synthase
MSRTIYLETYGCQMNVYDSDLVRSILEGEGYSFTLAPEEADALLVNTCTVRESACERVYGRLGNFSRHKKEAGRRVAVGVLGCMAQDLKDGLLHGRGVDFIVGPDGYRHLPRLLEETWEGSSGLAEVRPDPAETYRDIVPLKKSSATNAFVTVMRGCDNFCSFCVVPLTRGRERSRGRDDILAEIRTLLDKGYREFTLLGQNVNSYRDGRHDFAALLAAAAGLPGIRRLRFTSPHPKDFPRSLLQVIGENPAVCKQVHLPLQAGSDRILEKMRRTYTSQEFIDLADEIRAASPGICLSTDIIAGFPTETDAEFEATVAVLERVQFDSAFIFKYSERQDTIAQRKYPDDVAEAVKTERVVRLNALQKAISHRVNSAYVGRTLEVLLEGPSRKSDADLIGRDDGNHGVVVPKGSLQPGQLVAVKILGEIGRAHV